MGNSGKSAVRAQARQLRAQSWTLRDIATELGVSRSSVSLWCRDVAFVPEPRHRGHAGHRPHPLRIKRLAEVEQCRVDGLMTVGEPSDREFLMYGLGLYHGEGAKTDGGVRLANTSPQILVSFLAWLRRFFVVDERRLRVRLYLHEGLDLEGATAYWSALLGVPESQFHRPFRPTPRSVGGSKHLMGCATVVYSCSLTHRRVMGMIDAVSSSFADPG